MAQNKTQNYLRHEKFDVKLQKLRLNKDESCKIGEFKEELKMKMILKNSNMFKSKCDFKNKI